MKGGRVKAPTRAYVVRRIFGVTEYLDKQGRWMQIRKPKYTRPIPTAAKVAANLRRQSKVIEYPIFIVGEEV